MMSERVRQQIDKSFSPAQLRADQVPRWIAVRDEMRELAKMIAENTPESREQSLALTKLEEAVMWACAAIVNNE
jgi:hypothetical protein